MKRERSFRMKLSQPGKVVLMTMSLTLWKRSMPEKFGIDHGWPLTEWTSMSFSLRLRALRDLKRKMLETI